jgi:hypothetical protein
MISYLCSLFSLRISTEPDFLSFIWGYFHWKLCSY